MNRHKKRIKEKKKEKWTILGETTIYSSERSTVTLEHFYVRQRFLAWSNLWTDSVLSLLLLLELIESTCTRQSADSHAAFLDSSPYVILSSVPIPFLTYINQKRLRSVYRRDSRMFGGLWSNSVPFWRFQSMYCKYLAEQGLCVKRAYVRWLLTVCLCGFIFFSPPLNAPSPPLPLSLSLGSVTKETPHKFFELVWPWLNVTITAKLNLNKKRSLSSTCGSHSVMLWRHIICAI